MRERNGGGKNGEEVKEEHRGVSPFLPGLDSKNRHKSQAVYNLRWKAHRRYDRVENSREETARRRRRKRKEGNEGGGGGREKVDERAAGVGGFMQ